MKASRLALALVVLLVASAVGVGSATSPSSTATRAEDEPTMGGQLSAFMAASAAQTDGSVENGMWEAAYADASNASAKRALVESRIGSLNTSVAELQQERRELREAYRNGTINETAYQAQLATIVGQLAAAGEGIETTSERGRAVGVNTTALEELRSRASELGGGAVSQLARNLTGGGAPPGQAGVFGGHGQAGDRGQDGDRGAGNATNATDGPGEGGGPPDGQGPPDQEPGPPSGNETAAGSEETGDG